MGINVQFPSTSSGFTAYGISVKPAETADADTTAPAEAAYVPDVGEAAKAMALDDGVNAPLSDKELEQLFSLYGKLGDDNPLMEDIGRILSELTYNDRTNFLTVLSRANDELEGFVGQAAALEADDRSVFLRTAVRIGPGEVLADLSKALGTLDGEGLTAFLGVADQLNRSADSIKARELQNFITAAAGLPGAIQDLTAKTIELTESDSPDDRANFLDAAAGSGRDLDRLIASTDEFTGEIRSRFLASAAGAGNGLSNLLTLSQSLSGEQAAGLIHFTAGLNQEDRENFLLATDGQERDLARLMSVSGRLSGDNRHAFLSLAATAGDSLGRMMTLVEGLDPATGEQANFLSAGMTSAHNFTGFLETIEVVSPGERTEILSFAADLSLSDLAGFISAAGDGSAHDLARAGSQLSGKERSYFLYTASLMGPDTERLVEQTLGLEGTERRDFLFAAANSDPDSVLGLNYLLDTTDELDGQDRADFLAGQRSLTDARTGMAGEYVYLNAFYGPDTGDALLSSGARLDDLLDGVNELDRTQRKTFLSIAETAGPEMMEQLLSVTDRLQGDENDRFMDFARGLNKKNLSNFLEAADTALDGSDLGKTRLARLMTISESPASPQQEDFLNAAAGAGTALDAFMNMTERLGGSRRTDFLIAADDFVERPDGELLLAHFISATDRMLERNFDSFMAAADDVGRRPSDVIDAAGNLVGTGGPYSIDDFLKSAAWFAESGASNEGARRWVDSFLGIPDQG